MEKYIPLSGLANNPSDNEAQDGQLAVCVNMINENNTLHPVALNDNTASGAFAIGNKTCELLYTHIGYGFKNHIIFCSKNDQNQSDPQYYYLPEGGTKVSLTVTEQDEPYIPGTFKANSITSIGSILVLTGDDTTYYAYWNGSGYDIISNFNYNVNVITHPVSWFNTHTNEDNTIGADLVDHPPTIVDGKISPEESREIYNALVAKMNSLIAEGDSRHIMRGTRIAVVALRLYDESYIAISDPFMIAPEKEDGFGNLQVDISGTSITKAYAELNVAMHSVIVSMHLSESLRKIVNGASVFVSLPLETWEVDTTHTKSQQSNSFPFQRKSEEELYKEIDNLSFFRSITLSCDDLNNSTEKELENVTGAEEHISLADFRRTIVSAKTTYIYNNRLHIAGIAQNSSDVMKIGIKYKLPKYYLPESSSLTLNDDEGAFLSWWAVGGTAVADGEEYYVKLRRVPCKAVVSYNDGRQTYHEGLCSWPLPPIISFPDRNATKIEYYINVSSYNFNSDYYKATINLRQSAGFGCAYHINIWPTGTGHDNEFRFLPTQELENVIEEITIDDYNDITDAFGQLHQGEQPLRTTNILRYSEAENPFVFPVTNYIAIGAAEIIAMATSTQPISEGQFGIAPLYVFTSDATWALSVGNDGTYEARQPATRDVILNKDSVTPIDNAVLFTTERGIMLLRGNTSVCISEALEGKHFNFASAVDENINVLQLKDIDDDWLATGNFRTSYLPNARMLYDYAHQRLVVVNPAYRFAYVYSFKSELWGSLDNKYMVVKEGYPYSYGIVKVTANLTDTLYAVKAIAETEALTSCKVMGCTRPLQIDAPFAYKTIESMILRGFFERGEIATVLYASNDLIHWRIVNSSVDNYLRGRLGTPHKYYRLAFLGSIGGLESISGIHTELIVRWGNQIR